MQQQPHQQQRLGLQQRPLQQQRHRSVSCYARRTVSGGRNDTSKGSPLKRADPASKTRSSKTTPVVAKPPQQQHNNSSRSGPPQRRQQQGGNNTDQRSQLGDFMRNTPGVFLGPKRVVGRWGADLSRDTRHTPQSSVVMPPISSCACWSLALPTTTATTAPCQPTNHPHPPCLNQASTACRTACSSWVTL